ncbi:MAG: hypothetical protein WCL14_02480 [Bacteroidota bacterium]
MGCGEKAKPFRRNQVTYQKPFRSHLPSKHSPDSSGSPLLLSGFRNAAATADSGTGHDTRRNRRLQIGIINFVL